MILTASAIPPGEPRSTIYRPWWSAAWNRLPHVEPQETRALLASAMSHVERGWPPIRDLQSWADSYPEVARPDDDYGFLLTFVEAEVREAFRSLARSVAELVTSWPGSSDGPTPIDAECCLSTFVRYASVLMLATESAGVPAGFRDLVRRVAPLRGGELWAHELAGLLHELIHRYEAEWTASGAREAVDALVRDAPDAERPRIRELLIGALEGGFASGGAPLPPWLVLLNNDSGAPDEP